MSVSSRKVLTGTVVQDVNDKTVAVRVERATRHPLYGKITRAHKKYQVHDETNQARIGDQVRIRQCSPISKHKHFYLESIVERAAGVDPVEAP